MKKISVIIFSVLTLLSNLTVVAQEQAETTPPPATDATTTITVVSDADGMQPDGFNKYSIRPIHQSDIMYKKTIIRAIDLREKANKPLFSRNREFSKLLIEAVNRGDIKAYGNDSLDAGKLLTIEEFMERNLIPSEVAPLTPEEREIALANGDSSSLAAGAASYYFATDLYQMEIKEDLIFDKQRSRMYYDIHAITLYVPSDHPSNIKGIQLPVASFSFKELSEKLFKDNPNAIWFNPQNDSQHKNLADAFELRLFNSYIIKVSNPSDAYLVDIYGGDEKKGILASQWAAFELLEYEHNLWEF